MHLSRVDFWSRWQYTHDSGSAITALACNMLRQTGLTSCMSVSARDKLQVLRHGRGLGLLDTLARLDVLGCPFFEAIPPHISMLNVARLKQPKLARLSRKTLLAWLWLVGKLNKHRHKPC